MIYRVIEIKSFIIYLATIAVFIAITLGCSKDSNPITPPEPPDYYKGLISNINDLSYALFNDDLRYRTTANIHIWGPQLYRGLSWIYFKTDDDTRDELINLLNIEDFTDSLFKENLLLIFDSLERNESDAVCNFNMGAFIRSKYIYYPPYENIMRDIYGCEIYSITQTDSISDINIRSWIEEKSFGEMTIDDGVTADIEIGRAFIVSYFKAKWGFEIDTTLNSFELFHHPFKKDSLVEMMNFSAELKYFKDSLIEFIDIPFGESNYSLSIILPVENKWPMPQDVVPTKDKLIQWLKNSELTAISINMPIIDIYDIEDRVFSLRRLGLTSLFYPKLEGWYPYNDGESYGFESFECLIRTRFSNSGFTVSTAKNNFMDTSPADSMIINHPFSYVIRDNITGVILGIGRIIEM